MPRPVIAKNEGELWHDLMQRQEDYAESLSRLDALVLDVMPAAKPLPAEWRLIEEAAEIRRVAYFKYRKAMDELTEFSRK